MRGYWFQVKDIKLIRVWRISLKIRIRTIISSLSRNLSEKRSLLTLILYQNKVINKDLILDEEAKEFIKKKKKFKKNLRVLNLSTKGKRLRIPESLSKRKISARDSSLDSDPKPSSRFEKNLLSIRPLFCDQMTNQKIKTFRGGDPIYLASVKDPNQSIEENTFGTDSKAKNRVKGGIGRKASLEKVTSYRAYPNKYLRTKFLLKSIKRSVKHGKSARKCEALLKERPTERKADVVKFSVKVTKRAKKIMS